MVGCGWSVEVSHRQMTRSEALEWAAGGGHRRLQGLGNYCVVFDADFGRSFDDEEIAELPYQVKEEAGSQIYWEGALTNGGQTEVICLQKGTYRFRVAVESEQCLTEVALDCMQPSGAPTPVPSGAPFSAPTPAPSSMPSPLPFPAPSTAVPSPDPTRFLPTPGPSPQTNAPTYTCRHDPAPHVCWCQAGLETWGFTITSPL